MSNKSIAALVIGFLILTVSLNFLNLTDFNFGDILGYTIAILGLSLVYTAFKSSNKLLVFVGSGIFLTGVSVIIFNSFEIKSSSESITPLLLIISGLSVAMTYLVESSKKNFLILSIILFTAGTAVIFFNSPSKLLNIFNSYIPVFGILWPLIIILAAIVLLSIRDDKN